MPVTFHIPRALREFTDRQGSVTFDESPATVAGALSMLWARYPALRDRIATEQGEIRQHVNIFVGNEDIRYTGGLSSPVPEGSTISIVPAVSGGKTGENMRQLVVILLTATIVSFVGCKASSPSSAEEQMAMAAKKMTIGGKDWKNPTPDNADTLKTGMEHFQHHCQVCHGLDGHSTGVPFAAKMSPPIPDLGVKDVQQYEDGQLKWIIENGIRFSGMPGWKGVLEDDEMWSIVRFLRHLPEKGSQGVPGVYEESEEEHHHAEEGSEHGKADDQEHHHH